MAAGIFLQNYIDKKYIESLYVEPIYGGQVLEDRGSWTQKCSAWRY